MSGAAQLLNWPATRDVVLPRDARGRQPDPVPFILGLAAEPWKLVDVATVLRASGEVDIPRKVEAEIAAALHWLLGFAIRDGADWLATHNAELGRLVDLAKARQQAERREGSK